MLLGRIEGATRQLGKPADWPEDKPCLTLSIRDHRLESGDNVMESAWQPTPQEVEAISAGAHIHLWVWGEGHPPVAITVDGAREFQGNAFYGPGGALVSDVEIPGVTQLLSDDNAKYYKARYFIGESIRKDAARVLATLLGLRFIE